LPFAEVLLDERKVASCSTSSGAKWHSWPS